MQWREQVAFGTGF